MLGTWTGTAGGTAFSVIITSYTTDDSCLSPPCNLMDFEGTYAWPGIQPGCAANGGISGTLCLPGDGVCGSIPSGTAVGQMVSSLCAQATLTGTMNGSSLDSWSGVISSCNLSCNQFNFILTK